MKEVKSFLASKIISIPDILNIEKFELISSDLITDISELDGSIYNVVSEYKFPYIKNEPSKKRTNRLGNTIIEQNELILTAIISKRVEEYLIELGIQDEFAKWINPTFSQGDTSSIDDDVRFYIRENIIPRYTIKSIVFYEYLYDVSNVNDIELGKSDGELIQLGFRESDNFKVTKSTTNDLDFGLIYKIPNSKNFSVSFTVIVEKK